MSGLVSVCAHYDVAAELNDALCAMYHRGHEQSAILTMDADQYFFQKIDATQQFSYLHQKVTGVSGNLGLAFTNLGQVRDQIIQPATMYLNYPYGLSLCLDGCLTHKPALKQYLISHLRCIQDACDIELMLNFFAHELSCLPLTQPF